MTAKQFTEWRKRMGWTQVEAAQHLGRSRQMVSNYESGADIPTVIKLACEALEDQARLRTIGG